MSVSFFILCWWYFSFLGTHPDKTFNIYFYGLKMLLQIFVSRVYRSVFRKRNSLYTVELLLTNLKFSEDSILLIYSFSWFMKLINLHWELMSPCYSLLDMKVFWAYYFLLISPCKFISGFLYFTNNSKRHKGPNIGLWNKL